MNPMRGIVAALGLTTLLSALMAASAAKTPRLPDDPRDVPREAQLNVVVAKADLNGDGTQEFLYNVNALTGESDPAKGSEVIYGVALAGVGSERGPLLWVRHVMAETGRPAHDGELAVVDFDGDGRSDLLLTWDTSLSANRVERVAEVYTFADPANPRRVWEGWWETDTRRDQDTPESARTFVRRDVDLGATRRAAGKTLVLRKTTTVENGRRLDKPRVEKESFAVSMRAVDPS